MRVYCILVATLCMFFLPFLASAHQEYVYPVASYTKDNGEVIAYLLYQKSLNHIELWEWNPITKQAHKALLSTYTPAGIRMLPDKSGFSFIDDGRIRIKQFTKRSPKTIDVYQPVHNIGVVEWIDGHHGYFSACKNKRHAVFHLALCGPVEEVLGDSCNDYLYPQKVGEYFFYIKRTAEQPHNYCIASKPYPLITHEQCNQFSDIFYDHSLFDSAVIQIRGEEKILIDCGESPLIFLTMISDELGFVIGHPPLVDKKESLIPFSFFLVKKQNEKWLKSCLFSFSIPMSLLSSSSCLYESLLPLIPLHQGDSVYFVNASEQDLALNIYCCSLSSGVIAQCSNNIDPLFPLFCPRTVGNQLMYGGSLIQDADMPRKNEKQIPFMMFDSEGEVCFYLPSLTFNNNFNV